MPENLIARAEATINAPRARVWEALVTPALIKQYMFGSDVISDWKKGSPIVWKGEWKGKAYEDKGTVLQVEPGLVLQYTHFSPLSGLPDVAENYHTVTIELSEAGVQTRIVLAQDNNPTEQARAHSEQNWAQMLAGLKKLLESS
jgi:uncharacterized protein YndB with AHSA1/START domain